jgi:hypothetical protein
MNTNILRVMPLMIGPGRPSLARSRDQSASSDLVVAKQLLIVPIRTEPPRNDRRRTPFWLGEFCKAARIVAEEPVVPLAGNRLVP